MESFRKDLAFALAVIVTGSLVGVAWNWRLVSDAWEGNRASEVSRIEDTPAGGSSITVQEVKTLFDSKAALIVDARRAFFFDKERIPGAVSLPLAEYDPKIAAFLQDVSRDRLLVLYCSGYGCEDSHQLSEKLLQAGYKKARVFPGGLPEWKEAGYPTEGTDVHVR